MKALTLAVLVALAAVAAASTTTTSTSTTTSGTSTVTLGKPELGETIDSIHSVRAFASSITAITLTYDIRCINNYEGKWIALEARNSPDASFIEIDGLGSDVTVDVEAVVRNTPEQDKPGHGDYSGTTSNDWIVGNTVEIPNTIAAIFNKGGGGRPSDWRAATGNPYIYFSPDNGWDCECVREDGLTHYCDSSPNGVKSNGQFDDICCEFQYNHKMGNGPRPRERKAGDIYAGRCKQWLDEFSLDQTPASTIVCKTTSAAVAQASFQTYPTCGSVKHNIGLGIGMNLVDHHRIIASQVGINKFLSCDGSGDCLSGAGPHETYTEDTCIQSPPLGAALIDKSAGIKQNDPTGAGEECGTQFRSVNGTTGTRNPGDFTSCGVGGNPCIVSFMCSINGESCFSDPSVDTDINVLDDLPCIEEEEKKCPNGYGCRCSQVREQTKQVAEVPC